MCARSAFHGRTASARAGQRGFSLVELMVALVVSLLVGISALESAQFFMASQRQGVGAGSALGDMMTATASLKHELGQTGLGFFREGAPICDTLNLSSGTTAVMTDAPFVPLNVTNTAGSAVLDIFYASSLVAAAPAIVADGATTQSPSVEVQSYLPAATAQAVLLTPPAGSGLPCTVRSVTSVVAADEYNGMQLNFGSTGRHNQWLFDVEGYPPSTSVALLGTLQWSRFRIEAGNLVMELPMETSSAVVARDVVSFRVQYGVTDGVTSTLGSWEDPLGGWSVLTSVLLLRISAVRVGMVVRSGQRERADAGGVCTASTAQPVLFDEPLALTGDWRCFRYRTSVIVVPLRNALMGRGV